MTSGMKKILISFLTLLIIIFASSCSDAEKFSEADAIIKDGATDFIITRSDIDNGVGKETALSLRKQLAELTGMEFKMGTDFYKEGNPNFAIPECEILVGSTDRDEYRELADRIPKNHDWLIARKGNKILIAGSESLPDALDYFIENYVADGNVYVPDGELYVHTGDYLYDSIKLGSRELSDCEIVYQTGNTAAQRAAEDFRDRLSNEYGVTLKVSSIGEAQNANDGQICFFTDYDPDGEPFRNSCVGGESLMVSCGFLSDLSVSADMLADWMESNVSDKVLTINQSLRLEATKENGNMKIADGKVMAELDKKADEMKKAVLESDSEYEVKEGCKVYYFAADGDDSNDGLSPEKPKRSLSELEKITFVKDDVVLFKRGDTFRGKFSAKSGVTYSAYGEGDKPTINSSAKNYADPMDWEETGYKNVWKYRGELKNVGIMLFDYSGKIGNYEEIVGTMRIAGVGNFENEKDLDGDLQFWSDLETNALYLYSEENPGERFKSIEIGTSGNTIAGGGSTDVTIDNLHIMLTGAHGVGFGTTKNLTVRNCIFDWLGGSILAGFGGGNTTRYGNAVEVYGGVDGYKVYNNWMYQIYDTGITHQFNNTPSVKVNNMNDVEYYDNLIEYCFWSIEYYNASDGEGTTRKTTNVYVHDNFCRLGGYGWGCKGRESSAPMYCLGSFPDVTENYVTENNIFDRCTGYLVSTYGQDPAGNYKFTHNTYVQPFGNNFANIAGEKQVFDGSAPEKLKKLLLEDDGVYYYIMDDTSDK